MRYEKPALTVEDQARLLLSRGVIGDEREIASVLGRVSYYRLQGYWHPFRLPGQDAVRPGTTFAKIWDLYTFDRELRLLVMDPIERVEVYVRSQLAMLHGLRFGPMAYAVQPTSMPELRDRQRFMETIKKDADEAARAGHPFVEHYRQKYTSEAHLPVWAAVELLSFGGMYTFFNAVDDPLRAPIARGLGVHPKVLRSWLRTINTVRNLCAHHQRLWNRDQGTKPMIPHHDASWKTWVARIGQANTGRAGTVLMMLAHCLRAISPGSDWPARVERLLDAHSHVHLPSMGLDATWRTQAPWRL